MFKLDESRSSWLSTLTRITDPEAKDIRLPMVVNDEISKFFNIDLLPNVINEETIKPDSLDLETKLTLSSFEQLQSTLKSLGLNFILNLGMPECKENESKELVFKETFKGLIESSEILWGYVYTSDKNISIDKVIRFQEDDLPEEFWNEFLVNTEGSLPDEKGTWLLLVYKINSIVGLVNTTFFSIAVPYNKIEENDT